MKAVLRAPVAVALFSITLGPAIAEESCSGLRQIASVAIETMPNGLVYAPATIAGQSLNFLLQTESQGSLIRASVAGALALPRDHITDWNVRLNSDHLREFATADAMKFGGLTGKVRLAVAPDSDFEPELSGLLGADFFRNFDVDFDFAKSRLNLFSPDHCQGGVVYWTRSGASRVPMEVNQWGQIRVDAELEGKSIPAELATGMTKSVLMIAEDEAKFGEQAKQWKLVKAGESHDFPRSYSIYEHVFNSLTISGIEVHNVDLTIHSGARPFVGGYLYLGMDILRQLHLYVAYKERNLYVSAASAALVPSAQQSQ